MKLFFYYVFHTFINALRKVFKTWMLVLILVCTLMGGLIGLSAAALEDMAESSQETVAEESVVEAEGPGMEERLGIDTSAMVELAVGALVLLIFVFNSLSADKNGGKIFLPADIPVLFASPMQPQSVLLFRMGTQMGQVLLLILYLCLQLPNLVLNLGLSLTSAISIIVAVSLAVGVGKLLQVLLYMLCARSDKVRSSLRYWIYGLLGGLFLLFFLNWKLQGGAPAAAAARIFNGPVTRFIPLWGWIKGFCCYAVAEMWPMALLELLLTVLGMGGLIWIIYITPADFYEDAMTRSEEAAEAARRAQGEETSLAMGKRKKARSEKLRRDGMNRGSGPNILLWKTVYNRFRFAHFGFLTKTLELYLFVAFAVGLVCRVVLDTAPFYPVVLILAVLSFYRSLGDSLAADVKMDFFLLIPGSTESKLFYSQLGSTMDCFLDLLPAMLCTLLMGASPADALLWLLFILSVDLYGSTVAAFMDASTPAGSGKIIKTVFTVMFVYFGLIPDGLILAVGLILDQAVIALCASAAVNILLTAVFLSLIPRFIDPPIDRPAFMKPHFTGDMKRAKKSFSRVGWGVFIFLALGSALQLMALRFISPLLPAGEIYGWLLLFLPLYLVAFPLAILIMGKAPEEKLREQPLGFTGAVTAVIISVSLMYLGNLIGTLFTYLLAELSGTPAVDPVDMLVSGESVRLRVLFVVVIAPFIEEFTFRKCIIDRLHIYGQKRAVLISALLFGLFHGNFSQFFYAFLLGLVFGTVYVKTARLRYSVILHMFINAMGGILAPWLLEQVDMEALNRLSVENMATLADAPMLLYFTYAMLLMLTSLLGWILLVVRRKELRFPTAKYEADGKNGLVMSWCNGGMIVNLLCCLFFMFYVAFVP